MGEASKFVGRTDNFAAMHGDGEESFDEVAEWGQIVHPGLPKLSKATAFSTHDFLNGFSM